MDPNILLAIIGGAALAVGLGLGKFLFARNTQKKMEEAEIKAETILKEAELRAETVMVRHHLGERADLWILGLQLCGRDDTSPHEE